tara:strand:- start:125 stop:745 length:621 start_codon:yes stop_codon:yes gene_type:complete
MKFIISAAVLALIQNSGVQAIHHRHQAYGASRGSIRGHTKDIGMDNIDPWVYDMVSPEVEVTAWGRPAEAPARKSYTPYSAAKPDAPVEAAPAEAAPAELLGLYQYGHYRPVYANPDGSMLVFTTDGEEPAAEAPAEEAKAPEGEAKEEKKAAEEEVVEGEDLEKPKVDLNDPTRNNVVADGNSWTMKMSNDALERDTPFPLKWAN